MSQPTSPDRAVTIFVACVAGLILGLIVAVCAFILALLYGYGWGRYAAAHGPLSASLIVAAVSGAGAGLWAATNFAFHHWNCDGEHCELECQDPS